ncbi:MAG: MBL fold metallo-hydrolase, partial [Spirochaetes bacterium]|nr:MBL fold metallo-hydrolase [Spirochaetota bacterium]
MKLFKINDMCYCVAIDESLSCAFGSPPEWIKSAKGFPFPSYIFLGDTILSQGTNFCEVEFPVYRNFFFNRQRKTHIVAPAHVIEVLKPILDEAIFGPSEYESNFNSQKAEYYADYLALREGFSFSGRKLLLPDFLSFENYDNNTYQLGLVTVKKIDCNSFLITKGREEIAIELKEQTNTPKPTSTVQKRTNKRQGTVTLYCFDSGDGFSPAKECSSFMLGIGESYLLFDPNYSSFDSYHALNLNINELKGIFISHIHADHEEGLYRFLHAYPHIPVYAAGEVAKSLEKKIRFFLKNSSHSFIINKLPMCEPSPLGELNAEVFCEYGFHSIPSAMMKFRFFDIDPVCYLFGYSGDTLYDPVRFREERFPPLYR